MWDDGMLTKTWADWNNYLSAMIGGFLGGGVGLMGLRIAALKEVEQGGKIPISSGLRSTGVTDEWGTGGQRPGNRRTGPAESRAGVEPRSAGALSGALPFQANRQLQRRDPPADPGANTVSCD
ncbi:hypothetical protein B0H14DRAFT_2648001 [Mycena olivaceomarginata]|nr:hypothetical protein B0H14DRAFT_2648001 [Mycena olivaceomarginata]